MKQNIFYNKDLISVEQLSRNMLEEIFTNARKMQAFIEKKQFPDFLQNKSIVQLFYQPSTRTFTSFLAAATYLGAKTIPIHGMQAYSSAVKGESLPDTVRTVEQTTACNLIVLRHPDNDSARQAAKYASVPVVNAGSGTLEHPTQAIQDIFTLKQKFSTLEKLNITFVGDLKYGRTVKSLAKLLKIYCQNITMNFVSPSVLRLPNLEFKKLSGKGIKINQDEKIDSFIKNTDILYVTRVQKEWFEKENNLTLYEKVKNQYVITPETLKNAKNQMIIMHPLPRVSEISPQVDGDKRAFYFKQMRSGLYTRMAILKSILQKN